MSAVSFPTKRARRGRGSERNRQAEADVAADLARWEAAGIGRVMLQLLDMDDLDAIRLIGRELT